MRHSILGTCIVLFGLAVSSCATGSKRHATATVSIGAGNTQGELADSRPWEIGLASCDAFIADCRRCYEQLPTEQATEHQAGLRESIAVWKEAVKTTAERDHLALACNEAAKALRLRNDCKL